MKTTIEISDAVLTEARRVAAREGTTLRALVEQGLRRLMADRRRTARFQLRDASVAGRGLQPPYDQGGWEGIRDAAYQGRGA